MVTVLASLGFFDNRFSDLLTLLGVPSDTVVTIGGWGDLIARTAFGAGMSVVGWRAWRSGRTHPARGSGPEPVAP